jgi:hypothetical protein
VRFKNPEVEVFLQAGSQPAPVLVIREGLASGTVELFDETAKLVRTVELTKADGFFEPAALSLPADGQIYRLRLTSGRAHGWEVQHDRNCRLTAYDPAHLQLPELLPRAYGFLQDGAKEVKVRLEATGEGFHMATLYDPSGQPVATVRRFVDFEDPGRYELELKASVSGETAAWSLELCNLRVLSIEGMERYWATSADDLFNPERPAIR